MTLRAPDRALRRSILRWYLAHRRDLPWRRTRDPYAIWVSEIMLQQTRVETAIPYYRRFLRRFPTVRSLARAPGARVAALWSGLGYYSRARNLHAAARLVVREHAGRLPDDPDSLRSLPGIGEYTAAALTSVAFGRPAAAVDGNVVRVLARIGGLRGARTSARLRRLVLSRARALCGGPRPGDWTQALMELGATVCLPRAPRCGACPVARRCAARASGTPDRYPGAARPRPPREERRLLLLARSRGRVLLVPRVAGGHAGWSLPEEAGPRSGRRSAAPDASRDAAAALLERAAGTTGAAVEPLASFVHRTYSSTLTYDVWTAEVKRGRPRGGARWVAPGELSALPLRSPALKAIRRLRADLE